MSETVVRLGTRRSALALAQAGWAARALELAAKEVGQDLRVELVELSSFGDETSAPLASLGGAGVFVSRLRRALAAGEVDAAVHSLKDLPTAPEPGLVQAAVPVREDPRDVLVCRDGLDLSTLGAGARVGTGSPRRAAQLLALGLDLDVVGLRGNVDSRMARVGQDLDAVVLAHAGLLRLGRGDQVSQVLDPLTMLPAPGQGALVLECRAQDAPTAVVLARLNDVDSAACVLAERTVLAVLEAGCSAPMGALAELIMTDGVPQLWLRVAVAARDGSQVLRASLTGEVDDPVALGTAAAARLLADGAGALMATAVEVLQ